MRKAVAAAVAATLSIALSIAAPASADEPPGPMIELYTMGPGEPIPERFGHSALCVRDPERQHPDRCYDYGAFDASDPLSLGLRFLRGESVFYVAVRDRGSMIDSYVARDRDVWRQTLPLARDQALAAAAILENDAKPENRYYHYHHYDDNCSTRVRDIIDEVTGGALSSYEGDKEPLSFRAYTRAGFAELPELLVLSDLVLGRAVDQPASHYEVMFLPMELKRAVEGALGAEAQWVHERRAPPLDDRPGPLARMWFPLLGLALLAPLVAASYFRRGERAAVAAAAVPLAVLGAVLWMVAIVSPLAEVRLNELLLAFMPTDAALPLLSRRRRWQYAMFRASLIAVVVVLGWVGLFTQPAHPVLMALLPLGWMAAEPDLRRWLDRRRERR